MYENVSANRCIIIHPSSFVGCHIDASMAHGSTEIIVPKSSVNGVTLVKEHGERNIFQVVSGADHSICGIFCINFISASHGFMAACACGYKKSTDQLISTVSIQHLVRKVDFNP